MNDQNSGAESVAPSSEPAPMAPTVTPEPAPVAPAPEQPPAAPSPPDEQPAASPDPDAPTDDEREAAGDGSVTEAHPYAPGFGVTGKFPEGDAQDDDTDADQ